MYVSTIPFFRFDSTVNYKLYTVKIHWSEISMKVDLLIEIPDSIPLFIIVFNKLKIFFDDLEYLATRKTLLKLSISFCVTWY
jgi:hypothetical protein